jgi:prepilin-type processing-associated H-X9-DG protein
MNGYIYSTKGDQRRPYGYGPRVPERYPDYIENVHDATKMPAFLDGIWVDGWPNANNPKPNSFEGLGGTMNPHMLRYAVDRHQLKQNVSFVDGHGETIAVEELWELEWHNDNYTYPPQ